MATVIRFARHGTKKKPYFRMVVQDHHSPRDGKFIEHIGAYDPLKGDVSLTVKRDRLEYWLSTGAQPSDSVRTRLKLKQREWAQAGGSATTPTASASTLDKPTTAKAPAKAKATKTKAKEA